MTDKTILGLTEYKTSDYLESIADIECYLETVLESVKVGNTPTKRELESELGFIRKALENSLAAVKRLGESDADFNSN